MDPVDSQKIINYYNRINTVFTYPINNIETTNVRENFNKNLKEQKFHKPKFNTQKNSKPQFSKEYLQKAKPQFSKHHLHNNRVTKHAQENRAVKGNILIIVMMINHLRNFLFFLLCIGFLGLMFYWRVVYLREPRPLSLEFNLFRLTIGYYIIFMCIVSLYKLVFVKETTNSFFKSLSELFMLSINAITEGFFLFIIKYNWGINSLNKL